jgi:hypothetical protein
MARNALPAIAVKEDLASRRLKLPAQVDAHIRKFAQFYSLHTGGRLPDENAVIVGILKDYMEGNTAFQQYLKDQRRLEAAAGKRAGTATAVPSPSPAPVSEDAAGRLVPLP